MTDKINIKSEKDLNEALNNLFCIVDKNYTFVDKLPIAVKNMDNNIKQFVKLVRVEIPSLFSQKKETHIEIEYGLILIKEDKKYFDKHKEYPTEGILCCNDLTAIFYEIKERLHGLKEGEYN